MGGIFAPVIDLFLRLWLRHGRYRWSRSRRTLFERKFLDRELPLPDSLQDIVSSLGQVEWTMDGPLHLYDSIGFPETVWSKKRDDCDGFAVLAAALLERWEPSHEPHLLTVMLRPVKQSHTVCVFRQGDGLRFFDNSSLDDGLYDSYAAVARRVKEKRGDRVVCWDVVEPQTLGVREFHRGGE